MNKLFMKVATLSVGLAMAIGVGVAVGGRSASESNAATIGTHLVAVNSITSGQSYVIARGDGAYCLPTNLDAGSNKYAGTLVASVPNDGAGYLWTFEADGDYWSISNGTNYIYRTSPSGNGTNLTVGSTPGNYHWGLEYSSNHWTFWGYDGDTKGTRGMLCNSGTFGGYAIATNQQSYGYMNIYRVVSTATYSVTYKPGTGSGNDLVVQNQSGSYTLLALNAQGSGMNFTAPESSVFSGWSVVIGTAQAQILAAGTEITVSAAVVATAQWAAQRTVTYNSHGGTGTMTDPNSPYPNGAEVTVLDNEFTAPDGKIFDHWNTSENDNGDSYDAGDTFDILSNTTLYAQWANAVTVTYYANEGSGSMSPTVAKSGTNVTLTNNSFTRSGYGFTGWNTAANGSGQSYANGATIEGLSSNLDLYAQWNRAYVITFSNVETPADPGGTAFTDLTLNSTYSSAIPDGVTIDGVSGNIYGGSNKPLRINKGSGTSSFDITIDDDYYVTSVVAKAAYYGSDTTATLRMVPDGGSAQSGDKTLTSSYQYITYDLSSFEVNKFTVSAPTAGKRVYIAELSISYSSYEASITVDPNSLTFTKGDSDYDTIDVAVTPAHCTPDDYELTSDDESLFDPEGNYVVVDNEIAIDGTKIDAGEFTITVHAKVSGSEVATADISVTCNAASRNLESIEITTASSDVEFETGGKFTISNLVITGSYDAAPLTANVTSECVFKIGDTTLTPGTSTLSTAGNYTVKISHPDLSESSPLTYSIVVCDSVSFSVTGDDTSAAYQTLHTKNINVTLNSTQSLTSTIDVDNYNFYKNSGMQMNPNKNADPIYIKNTTAVPGKILRVEMTWTSGTSVNTPTLYFSDSYIASKPASGGIQAESGSGTITVNATGNNSYFYFDGRTTSGTCVMSEFKVVYVENETGQAKNFADKYLLMNTYDQGGSHGSTAGDKTCLTQYSVASTAYGKLTPGQKTEFAKLTAAVTRMEDWATANGYTFNASSGTFTQNSNLALIELASGSSNAILIIIVASIVSLTAIGGYFLFKKKKQN